MLISAAAMAQGVRFAPYYNFQLTEGLSMPSRGNMNFDLNLLNDIGLLARIDEAHSILGFYEIKYTGPGIKRQEGEQFTDRTLDHMFVLRHTWNSPWDLKVKTQVDYWKDFRRSGTNEIWGKGLYDFDRIGGLVGVEKILGEFKVGGSFQYHSMIFPNYTDLVSELKVTEGGTVESSTGKQDHALVQLGATGEWKEARLSLDYTMQNYFKQKVIASDVQPDGTFYTGNLQQDKIFTARLSKDFSWGILSVSPELTFGSRSSNQNYQHFENVTSTVSAGYYPDYYSYSQTDISIPVALRLGAKWEFFTGWEQETKSYASRPARDADGNFLPDKQSNVSQFISAGFNYHPNDVTTTTFYYVSQNSSSNMKFEKYFPYNFTAASYGIRFSYQY